MDTYDHAPTAQAYRELADYIAALPATVPDPTVGDTRLTFYVWTAPHDDAWNPLRTIPQEVQRIRRALGGQWDKNEPVPGDEFYYRLTLQHQVAGRSVQIVCHREEVCERIQVGTEVVVVPAAPAVEEHTEERPVYRYECRPLADAAAVDLEKDPVTA